MKQKTLFDYLQGKISNEKFQKLIESEVNTYVKARNKTSSAIAVDKEDNIVLNLTSKDVGKLLTKYLNDQINVFQLEYLLNYIEFAQFDVDSKLFELIFELSTPELFGSINKKRVQAALQILDSY